LNPSKNSLPDSKPVGVTARRVCSLCAGPVPRSWVLEPGAARWRARYGLGLGARSVSAGFFDCCSSKGRRSAPGGPKERELGWCSGVPRISNAGGDRRQGKRLPGRKHRSCLFDREPGSDPEACPQGECACSRSPALNPTSGVVTCCDQNPRRVQERLPARANKNLSIWKRRARAAMPADGF
jgi:hypothetical protein